MMYASQLTPMWNKYTASSRQDRADMLDDITLKLTQMHCFQVVRVDVLGGRRASESGS